MQSQVALLLTPLWGLQHPQTTQMARWGRRYPQRMTWWGRQYPQRTQRTWWDLLRQLTTMEEWVWERMMRSLILTPYPSLTKPACKVVHHTCVCLLHGAVEELLGEALFAECTAVEQARFC